MTSSPGKRALTGASCDQGPGRSGDVRLFGAPRRGHWTIALDPTLESWLTCSRRRRIGKASAWTERLIAHHRSASPLIRRGRPRRRVTRRELSEDCAGRACSALSRDGLGWMFHVQFPIKGNRNPKWRSTSGCGKEWLRHTSIHRPNGDRLSGVRLVSFRLQFVCGWRASRPDRQFASRIYALRFSMEAVLGRGGTFFENGEGSIQQTWPNARCPDLTALQFCRKRREIGHICDPEFHRTGG